MDLPEIATGFPIARWLFGVLDIGSYDVELVTVVPDKLHTPRIALEIELEHKRLAPAAHRQDQALGVLVVSHGLRWPIQRKERLLAIRIAQPRASRGLVPPSIRRRLDVRQELMDDHL